MQTDSESELESTVKLDQETSKMERQIGQLEKKHLSLLLGSNITTLQFRQGSFRERVLFRR